MLSAPGGYTAANGTTVTGAGSISGNLTTAAESVLRPAGLQATTEAIQLTPDADTQVNYGLDQGSNFGASGDLQTRQNDSGPRDFMAYIRFDLSSITTPITDATFTATKSGGDALIGGRYRVLSLNGDAGNTDQNWGEAELTWNTLGAEIDTSIYPGPAGGHRL